MVPRNTDMGSILSVNPEIFRVNIRRVVHEAVSTAAQNLDILQVLAVGENSLQPSITSSSARRNNLTLFSPENGTAEHYILHLVRRIVSLKRVRISHFFSKYLASGYDFFQSEKRLRCVIRITLGWVIGRSFTAYGSVGITFTFDVVQVTGSNNPTSNVSFTETLARAHLKNTSPWFPR